MKLILKKYFCTSLFILLGIVLVFNNSLAGSFLNEAIDDSRELATHSGFGYGVSDNPKEQLLDSVVKVVVLALSFVGIILFIIILYAGFLWMTAGGDTEQVAKAQKWILNSIIGLLIILSAYGISKFVINQMLEATMGTTNPNL